MYLLKHICIGVNSVINQLIVALVLTTSACLSSYTADAGATTQRPVMPGTEITITITSIIQPGAYPTGKAPITYY
jgi:hypothetical protein